jgi:hypothetical protein
MTPSMNKFLYHPIEAEKPWRIIKEAIILRTAPLPRMVVLRIPTPVP